MKKFLLIICAALLIVGCGNQIQSAPPLPPSKPQVQNFDTDIYFDATVSMKGFTSLAAGNVYLTLPDLLGDLCSASGNVQFFSFGAEIHPLDGRNYRRFATPEVYNEAITSVANVIDRADLNHLTIIITDLFENDADWSNVSQKIRDKFFANHLSAAVIGIKNSFYGEIYDVGLNAAHFNYNSSDNPEKFRPFYLLIMGNDDAVKNFIRAFNQRQTLPNETGYLLLSENLSDNGGDFSAFTLGDVENFYSDDTLNLPTTFKEFGLDNFNAPASFILNWSYQPPLGSCNFDFSDFDTEILIYRAENDSWTPLDKNNDVRSALLKDDRQRDSFLIKISLTPEKSLAEGNLNLISVTIRPKNLNLPSWVDLWSVNVDGSAKKFDGSKTANLNRVLESLKNSILAASRPNLLQINFVVAP